VSLRVLTVSDVSALALEGGGERVLWEVARRLAGTGHAVRILSRAPADVAPRRVRREDVEIREFASTRRSLAGFLRSAVYEARRSAEPWLSDTDVLHLHQPLSGYGVLTSRLGRTRPSLYTFHSPAPLEYRSRRRMTAHHLGGLTGLAGMLVLWKIEAACLRRATRIHVLSDFSASLLWKLYRIPAERIVKIAGGADLARFTPAADRGRVRAELGLPLDRPLLLTVRNLETRMGLDTLLTAMAGVARQRPDVHLLLGGSGSLRAPLEAQARAAGLDKHVTFLGFIPEYELPRYYQAADAFVLPTRELEGFGLVTVEALACGTPVIGTRVGATPELLEALDPGLVFSGLDAAAMAADLVAFLERQRRDPDAAAALRAACRRHAERHYGWDTVVAGLADALRGLATNATPAPVALVCDACGGAMRASALAYDGHRYARCPRCGARRMETLPSDSDVLHQYEAHYPRRFPPDVIGGPRREMLQSLVARAGRHAAPGRLLDVGCGGGHLMADAAARGWRVVGSDLSHEACAVARRASGAPVVQADADALPFRTGVLDAVTLVNVLDHTTRPLAVAREAARVLRPGGLVAMRVPNGSVHARCAGALGRLGPGVRWRGWDAYPILHVFAFGPRALRRLAERAGFAHVTIVNSTLASPGPGRAASRMSGVARSAVRALAASGGALAAVLSRGRWRIAPSIELFARRREDER